MSVERKYSIPDPPIMANMRTAKARAAMTGKEAQVSGDRERERERGQGRSRGSCGQQKKTPKQAGRVMLYLSIQYLISSPINYSFA